MSYLMALVFPITLLIMHFVNGKHKNIPEIIAVTDTADFADLKFAIVKQQRVGDIYEYHLRGTYRNTVVGFCIQVKDAMSAGISIDGHLVTPLSIEQSGVCFVSTGKESNLFLNALSELYGMLNFKTFSKSRVVAACFSMNACVADLSAKKPYNFKLFLPAYNDGEEQPELFLHLKLDEGIVELHEKDMGYRKGVMAAFTH